MDLESATFIVDGKKETVPFAYLGYFFKPSVFGGHTHPVSAMPDSETKFFKGDLRFLRILHGVEKENMERK